MNNFKQANEMLNIEDTARWLGLDVKNHYISCPLHKERTPSMRLYRNSYHCFSCSESGDNISLTAKILNLTPYEALQTLNKAFNLSLELGKPVSRKNMRISKAIQKKQANLRLWYKNALIILSDYIRLCNDVSYNEAIEPEYRTIADTERIRVEDLQDRLMETEPEEAFKIYRKGVEAVDRKLQRKAKLERDCSGNRLPDLGSSD